MSRFTGDGIMGLFGAPTALDDRALRACLAAPGIQHEVKRLAVVGAAVQVSRKTMRLRAPMTRCRRGGC